MTWGRLDEPKWWWEFALDGVIGGVIGGLVTALAVWLTLKHERTLAARARTDTIELMELTSARSAALALIEALMRMGPTAFDADRAAAMKPVMREVWAQWVPTRNLVTARWPGAADEMAKFVSRATQATQAELADGQRQYDTFVAVAELADVAGRWLADPKVFEE